MKHILLLMIFSVNANTYVKTEETCIGSKCTKATVIKKTEVDDINPKELIPNNCLFDPKTNESVLIESYDDKTKKLNLIKQSKDHLSRQYIFTDSRMFNEKQVQTNCSGTIFAKDYVIDCIKNSNKHTYNIFCMEPRKKFY